MPEPTNQNNQNQTPELPSPQAGITWTALKPEKTVTEADIALQKLVELGENHAAITAALQQIAEMHSLPEIDPMVGRIKDEADAVLEFKVRLVARDGTIVTASGSCDIPQLLLKSSLQAAKQRLTTLLDDMIVKPIVTKFSEHTEPAQSDLAAANKR